MSQDPDYVRIWITIWPTYDATNSTTRSQFSTQFFSTFNSPTLILFSILASTPVIHKRDAKKMSFLFLKIHVDQTVHED